ncbi:MAG: DUF11 domain-containing protein, partial [Candidatus Desantisbacteria bacterium]
MAGTHRYANGTYSDMAHIASSIFEAVHETVSTTTSHIIQPHGFSITNHPGYPDCVLSRGAIPVSSVIYDLSANLNAEGFTTGIYDGATYTDLAATTNIQGQYTNAIASSFIHMEETLDVRQNQYQKVVTAMDKTFQPRVEIKKTVIVYDYTDTAPQTGQASKGDTLRYTIIGTNTGYAAAKGVVIIDVLPLATEYRAGHTYGPSGWTIYYSSDGGVSYTTTEFADFTPQAGTNLKIQFRQDEEIKLKEKETAAFELRMRVR